MLTGSHCILCDRPTSAVSAIVIDVKGPDRLGIGLCTVCFEKTGGRYSDEMSDKIHARFAANPGRYFAEPWRMGRMQ